MQVHFMQFAALVLLPERFDLVRFPAQLTFDGRLTDRLRRLQYFNRFLEQVLNCCVFTEERYHEVYGCSRNTGQLILMIRGLLPKRYCLPVSLC